MKTIRLLVLTGALGLFMIFSPGCKKDPVSDPTPNNNNNNNNTTTHARTVNAFGQPLADSFSCLQKFYNSSPDTATKYYYDSNRLLIKVVQQAGFNGWTDESAVDYFYDNLSRLTRIHDIAGDFILDYGSSADKVQTIIRTESNPANNDTIHCTYPDAFTIVGSHLNHADNTEMRDSLQFDANYNLVRSAFVVGLQGGPFAPAKIQTTTFSPTIKAVFYPSAQQEYLLFFKLRQGSDIDIWPIGRYMGTDTYIYDYTTMAPVTTVTHMFIVDQQHNTGNFPTYTKYQQDYSLGGGVSSLIIYNYEYDCN